MSKAELILYIFGYSMSFRQLSACSLSTQYQGILVVLMVVTWTKACFVLIFFFSLRSVDGEGSGEGWQTEQVTMKTADGKEGTQSKMKIPPKHVYQVTIYVS